MSESVIVTTPENDGDVGSVDELCSLVEKCKEAAEKEELSSSMKKTTIEQNTDNDDGKSENERVVANQMTMKKTHCKKLERKKDDMMDEMESFEDSMEDCSRKVFLFLHDRLFIFSIILSFIIVLHKSSSQ